VNDFFSVKVGISSKDAVNSMRSELLDLPDCWGELKWWRISQETRLQFFSPQAADLDVVEVALLGFLR